MNTKSIKTTLIAAFAAVLAPHYRNRLASFNLSRPWDDMTDKSHESTIASLTGAIPEAVNQFFDVEPHGFPTKQSLRSYLSIGFNQDVDALRPDQVIDGFDDLYNELLALFSLKHVVEVSDLRKMVDAHKLVEQSFRESNAELREINHNNANEYERDKKRHAVELAKIRTDFCSATNSYKSEADELRKKVASIEDQLTRSIELSEKRSVRVRELIEQNDSLQRKNEELVGLPNPHHWDDEAETDGDAMQRMSLPRSLPPADHRFADCIRVRDSLAMQLHESNSKLNGCEQAISGLNATISRIATERDDAKKEVTQLRKSVEALSNQVLSAKAEEWDRCISVTAGKVSDILKEFKIESPTNSILDMVRAACEAAKAYRVDSQGLEQQVIEIRNRLHAQSQFPKGVMSATAFVLGEGQAMCESVQNQLVHHILTTEQLAETTRTARSMEDRVNVVGYTPVPERQYGGGIPRMVSTSDVAGRAFDKVCFFTLLGGASIGILLYAAKYLGLLS